MESCYSRMLADGTHRGRRLLLRTVDKMSAARLKGNVTSIPRVPQPIVAVGFQQRRLSRYAMKCAICRCPTRYMEGESGLHAVWAVGFGSARLGSVASRPIGDQASSLQPASNTHARQKWLYGVRKSRALARCRARMMHHSSSLGGRRCLRERECCV